MTPYQHDIRSRDRRREPEYDFGPLVPLSWLFIAAMLAVAVFG